MHSPFARIFIIGLLGATQCFSTLLPRVDPRLPPTDEEWAMSIPPHARHQTPVRGQAVWVAVRNVPEGISDIETLYGLANKAFNWLKRPENCLEVCQTGTDTLIVAAFYDHEMKKVYASTIPRGFYQTDMNEPSTGISEVGRDFAPGWRAARAAAHDLDFDKCDAEDGAYYLRELLDGPKQGNYGDANGRAAPDDSKVAVWGVMGLENRFLAEARGEPKMNCPECQKTAVQLGIYTEQPGVNPPAADRIPTYKERQLYNAKLISLHAEPIPQNTKMTMRQIEDLIDLLQSGLLDDIDGDSIPSPNELRLYNAKIIRLHGEPIPPNTRMTRKQIVEMIDLLQSGIVDDEMDEDKF